ncbi:Hypothetical_protein [Hexamita inflata]|uniref:Hypothetical_protein n=1 Tax=Hexamita inflata TaxID=28002 RepID=A0AA86PPN3_9EUKA|nr:Hypothetical protein HINF_LOCUS31489 [Hexamita inflata]
MQFRNEVSCLNLRAFDNVTKPSDKQLPHQEFYSSTITNTHKPTCWSFKSQNDFPYTKQILATDPISNTYRQPPIINKPELVSRPTTVSQNQFLFTETRTTSIHSRNGQEKITKRQNEIDFAKKFKESKRFEKKMDYTPELIPKMYEVKTVVVQRK